MNKLQLNCLKITILGCMASILLFAFNAQAAKISGKELVAQKCAACHLTGVVGAPKIGNKEQWAPRIKKGGDVMLKNVIKGIGGMPARGGYPQLSDDDLKRALTFLLSQVGHKVSFSSVAPSPVVTAKAMQNMTKEKEKAKKKSALPPKAKSGPGANRFNRLMKPPSKRNPPPAKDGIHDAANQGTHTLQPPRQAFSSMPKSTSGNRVDWVKSLENGVIDPRYDRLDPNKKPVVLDLNIVREVKGSMPDVVYPHKQHTEWLDCSNCHPAIFIPKKGANQISMASILLGQKCGVCHGKVAFPVADCRKCHSKRKPGK